jgi:purine-binding chemotaxis protein CheW
MADGLELSHEDSGDEVSVPMFLTFALGAETYGIPLTRVLEIIGMQSITPIPDTPAYVRGVINLRGKVIPVVDARARFGIELRAYEARTVIIVVQTGGWSVGLVVDRVSDVVAIPEGSTEPPPPITARGGDHFLHGLGKVGDEVRLLLDVDRFLSETSASAA